MRTVHVAALLLALVPAGVAHSADRKWQTGTWTDIGVKRTPWVGDPVQGRMPPGFNRAALTEVATYVIETDDLRFELQDMVAIGREAFDFHVTIGHRVTFAVEKKTVYIKLDDGEYRLLLLKSGPKKDRREVVPPLRTDADPVMVIHAYKDGLAGLRAVNPDVHLRVDRDPAPDGPALLVEYPAPTADPAGRDVHCDAENHDWTGGRAISFHVKPAHSMRLSVSFLDRNRVAYTAWTDLKGGVWQLVRIPFDEIRPNPYFQLPDAKTGAPLDVSAVQGIAFAPHDATAGQLVIGRFVVSR